MWEGPTGMEGVAMQCGRGQGWRVWPCSVGGDRDGGCGHAVWEGSGIKGVAMHEGGVRGGGVAMQCGRGQG